MEEAGWGNTFARGSPQYFLDNLHVNTMVFCLFLHFSITFLDHCI